MPILCTTFPGRISTVICQFVNGILLWRATVDFFIGFIKIYLYIRKKGLENHIIKAKYLIGNKVITEFDIMLNTAFDNVTEVGLIALSFLYFLSVKVISHKPSIYLYAFSRFYTTFTNFSMKYHLMCKVYTNVGGINSYTMFVHLYVR